MGAISKLKKKEGKKEKQILPIREKQNNNKETKNFRSDKINHLLHP